MYLNDFGAEVHMRCPRLEVRPQKSKIRGIPGAKNNRRKVWCCIWCSNNSVLGVDCGMEDVKEDAMKKNILNMKCLS